jgi:RHS repeat-associated protein
VGPRSNRLTHTTVNPNRPDAEHEDYSHDAHGNITRMPHLPVMRWDVHDRLQMTQRQAMSPDDTDGTERQGERTYYVYDAAGIRVRKVTERATGEARDEHIYLGGFEVYRRYGAAALTRETLHVMDDRRRIALIETTTEESGLLNRVRRMLAGPATTIRYQLGNHLGSASVELDEQAQIVSYEEHYPYGGASYQALAGQTEVPKRHRYVGKERDEESGFDYYGARYLAPWLGRWTSCDPSGTADGVNLYEFVQLNPLSQVDRTGLQTTVLEADFADVTARLQRIETLVLQWERSRIPPSDVGISGVRTVAPGPRAEGYSNFQGRANAAQGLYKLAEIAEAGHHCTYCHLFHTGLTPAEVNAALDLEHYDTLAFGLGFARQALEIALPYTPDNLLSGGGVGKLRAEGGVYVRVPGRTRLADHNEEVVIQRSLAQNVEHSVSGPVNVDGDFVYRIGTETAVSVRLDVERTFHTHTTGIALFSEDDLLLFLREGNFPESAIHRVGGEKWPLSRRVDPEVPLVPVVTEARQADLAERFRPEEGRLIDTGTNQRAQTTLVDQRGLNVWHSVEEFLRSVFRR